MFDGSALTLADNLDIAVRLRERFARSDLILEIEVGVVGGVKILSTKDSTLTAVHDTALAIAVAVLAMLFQFYLSALAAALVVAGLFVLAGQSAGLNRDYGPLPVGQSVSVPPPAPIVAELAATVAYS